MLLCRIISEKRLGLNCLYDIIDDANCQARRVWFRTEASLKKFKLFSEWVLTEPI